jgi:transglutaminase-like putative cysteine protease
VIRRSATDGSLLASLPWTLAALGFAMLPHAQFLPPWITATFFACAAARWQMERKRWRLPPAWLRIVLSLLCFIGVFASYDTISGVGPGSALLAVMAALKLLETRKRRDQFVLLFISIFLIMACLLREQYVWSLPYLIAGLAVTMTAWLRMSGAASEPARRSFGTAGRLLAYAAPLCLAMWIFFPRIATPFWSVPIDTSAPTAGLSDRMSPGDISSLSLSDAVAFRARFEGAAPPPSQRYWRGLVLHRFNGRTWTGDDPSYNPAAWNAIDGFGEPVRYEITMEPTQQQWIYALDIPYTWSLEKAFMGREQQLSNMQPVDQRIAYSAVSYPQYRIETELTDWTRSRTLGLPMGRNPRTVDMARQMRRTAGTDEAFIQRVLRKFNEEEYVYTLQPPALGHNPVDQFLFETRRGFCEHYASAFAVMMRAAGLPSRIVLGYQGGEINPMGEYMIVRQSDAHAWTEVWINGRGWVRVDPTAAVSPERIESGMSGARMTGVGARWGLDAPSRLLHRLALTWDAFNARWNDWVLGYGPENQNLFMRWLGMQEPTWRKMMLILTAVLAVMLAALSVLLLRRYRPPKKDPAARLWRKFVRETGLSPELGESPRDYAWRVASAGVAPLHEVEVVTHRYLEARYGPANPRELEALQSAVEDFRISAGHG